MRRSLLPHLGFYIEQGGARLQGGFKWLANASQTTKDYLRPLAILVAFCARAFFASHPPHSGVTGIHRLPRF